VSLTLRPLAARLAGAFLMMSAVGSAHAAFELIGIGTLSGSSDLSGLTGALESTAPSSPAGQDAMAIGTWVDLLVAGKWERTQLSWIGPHGTLFLFTSAYGRTQSMTQRLLDRLIEQGSMRVVTPQTVVEGALDAVAQAAMRNSVDVRL